MGYGRGWRRYVPAAKRRERAAKKIAKLKKSGRVIRPVEIEGRKIARTFWGESWCENLEAYSDYANRLPRGRTYARNGSVIDLRIEAGRVRALISGSSFYNVDIRIKPLAKKRWDAIKKQCAGRIDSMVELLKGSISKGVMEIVTRHGEGLFPAPREIGLGCSCPDWAEMCKHVAAALYGVGARLDHEPRMLFALRGVDPAEMIAAAVTDLPTARKRGRGRILKTDDLSSVFGIDLDLEAESGGDDAPRPTREGRRKATAKEKPASRTKKTKKKKTTKKRAPAKSPGKKKPSARKAKAVASKRATKKTTVRKPTAKKRKKAAAKKAVARKVAKKRVTQKKAGTRTKTSKKAVARKSAPTRSRKRP